MTNKGISIFLVGLLFCLSLAIGLLLLIVHIFPATVASGGWDLLLIGPAIALLMGTVVAYWEAWCKCRFTPEQEHLSSDEIRIRQQLYNRYDTMPSAESQRTNDDTPLHY